MISQVVFMFLHFLNQNVLFLPVTPEAIVSYHHKETDLPHFMAVISKQ